MLAYKVLTQASFVEHAGCGMTISFFMNFPGLLLAQACPAEVYNAGRTDACYSLGVFRLMPNAEKHLLAGRLPNFLRQF